MRKFTFGFFVAAMLVSLTSAARQDEVTLVLVPRDGAATRVGMDVANRYPTLLVSYKVAGGTVSLHGWSGTEWVNISPRDFQTGNFFRTGPDSALLIENEGAPIPEALIPSESWCEAVYKITTTQTRPLLHLVGQYYDFKYKDWEWFAENYKTTIDAINPERLNVAWYHRQLGDHLKKSAAAGDDLQYWVAIRHPRPMVPAVEEPATMLETNVIEEVEQPEMELPEDPATFNPLTNEAPAAVVLGAGEAETAK